MKPPLIILSVGIFIILTGCATWTKEQVLLQGVASTLKIIDWGQTLDIADKPDRYEETNPILGKHPSRAEVNRYFGYSVGTQLLITHLLPSEWRKFWLGGWIGVSGYYVNHNYGVGLRVNF